MNEPLPLGRDRIRSFLLCQRQFELRTIVRLPWPDLPLEAETEQAVAQGRAFHQLLERHFLGMDVSPTPGPEASWWQAFQAHPPALPESGRRLPEVRLTVPIGGHLLLARFDLLVVGTSAESTPFVHIFDWKTSRARSSAELRNDWQTRLYLAMVAESGPALLQDATLKPDQIQLTYWYARDPQNSQTIAYDADWHAENWREINDIVARINTKLTDGSGWPKTDNLDICRQCAYQIVCHRQHAGLPTSAETDDLIDNWPGWQEIEPDDIVPQA